MAEERMEHGSVPVEDREQDVHAQFEQKIRDCFEQYEKGWLQKSPEALIKNAAEIATIQKMAEDLSSSVSEEDMEYLLRFKNPLEVASEVWCGSVFSEIDEDEFRYALSETRESCNLDESFALDDAAKEAAEYGHEPEHCSSAGPESQTLGLTMQT